MIRTAEAASLLGVSDRQVRHLVARGALYAPRRGHVSIASVDAYQARQGSVQSRVWEPRTAWAAIELLTGGSAPWLGSSQRSRLLRSLAPMEADEVVARLRNRAEVHTFWAEPERLGAVTARLVTTRSDETGVDGYVGERELPLVVGDERLVRRGEGNVVARALSETIGPDFVAVVAAQGPLLGAVDLAGSIDDDERESGLRVVADALSALR